MPEYNYYCNKCQIEFSINRSMDEYQPREPCPICEDVGDVYRDFSQDNIYTQYKLGLHEIKTLGHYAERQTEIKGSYEVESMRQKFKTKKDKSSLPEGFSRVTQNDYVNMPRKKKGKRSN